MQPCQLVECGKAVLVRVIVAPRRPRLPSFSPKDLILRKLLRSAPLFSPPFPFTPPLHPIANKVLNRALTNFGFGCSIVIASALLLALSAPILEGNLNGLPCHIKLMRPLRPAFLTCALPLHPARATSLQKSLQNRAFIFNNFQDAPPATSFLSTFCIVAGGWLGPLFDCRLPTVHVCSLYLLYFQSFAHSLAQWSTRNIFGISPLRTLFHAMGGGGMYTPSSVKEQ